MKLSLPAAKPTAPTKPAPPTKPVVAGKAPAKAPAAKEPKENFYRKMKKYTHIKLTELIAQPEVIRGRIGSKAKGALSAEELVQFLVSVEDEAPGWNKPKTEGKKRGRKPKTSEEKTAAKAAKGGPKAPTAPAAAVLKKPGGLLPPRAPAAVAPKAPAPAVSKLRLPGK